MSKEVIAVIDGGGRGSALVAAYARSPHVERILNIPGNDLAGLGIEKPVKTFPSVPLTNTTVIKEICFREEVTFVDATQDDAVAAGIVDILRAEGIPTLGPSRLAAEIEWSKVYGRRLGGTIGLPQPGFRYCIDAEEGEQFLSSAEDRARYIKFNGLAAGKGAKRAENNAQALERIREIQQYGNDFLIEELIQHEQIDDDFTPEEFSAFALCSGCDFQRLGEAQDHKISHDGDIGENTGGMGCSTPPLVLTPEVGCKINNNYIYTLEELRRLGRPYEGILYLGGMLVKKNGTLKPYVVEWNSRWGDPEAQAIVPGIKNDFFELSYSVIERSLSKVRLETDGKSRVAVAVASPGYPGDYKSFSGTEVFGINEVNQLDGVQVFGAGVKRIKGRDFAAGGRLLYVVGEGENVIKAREKALDGIERLSTDGEKLHFRTDIGWRDVKRLEALVV